MTDHQYVYELEDAALGGSELALRRLRGLLRDGAMEVAVRGGFPRSHGRIWDMARPGECICSLYCRAMNAVRRSDPQLSALLEEKAPW